MVIDQDPNTPEDNEIDWTLLLAPAAARWRLLLLAFVAAGVLGGAGSYLVTPTFISSTTFLPPQQQQSGASAALASLGALGSLAGGAASLRSPTDQYVSLMQSVTVTDQIIDQFKLLDVYEVKFRDAARRLLLRKTQMVVGKKDGLITVSVEDKDPRRAAAIANEFVEQLSHLTGRLAITEAQQRRVFFDKQLQQAKTRLVAAQIALQDSGFTAGALKAEPNAAADIYAKLRAELTTSQVRLETLRGGLSDTAPEVRQQAATVKALEEQLQKLERTDAPAQGSPDYIGKYREFKYQETLFDMMARQYEVARLDESREGAVIQVIDEARPAERKSFPRRLYFAVGGALAGAIAMALVVVVRAARRRAAAAPN